MIGESGQADVVRQGERMVPFRVGLIGCGRISDSYLNTCQKFVELEVVTCASLDIEESRAKADRKSVV